MSTTQNLYTGNGSTTSYSFTFEYLKQSDVKVTLDTVATTAFTFTNATTLSFTSAPSNGVAIRIFRDTAIDTLSSTFFPGSAIKAEDLNQNFTQSLYVTQESETAVGISDTTANTAKSAADSAVTTANSAVTTANAANTKSDTAVSTANTANTTAGNAETTANTADTNASAAVVTANAASAAVSNAVLFTLIANVAAIPGSPSNNDYVEIGNSTGIESFSPLSGLPSGFVGESGLTVRLVYDTSSTSWVFLNYFANDSEDRYFQKTGGTLTGDLTIPDKIIHSGDTNTFIRFPAADTFSVVTAGAERLRVDSSGNVGIGTNSPTAKLHIVEPVGTSTPAKMLFTNSGIRGVTVGFDTVGVVGVTDPNFSISNGDQSTNYLSIASNGVVGIGTTNPQAKLDVTGNGNFSGTVSAQGSILTSDQRFKENITDANSQLADVTTLGNQLRNWDWSSDAPVEDKDTRFLGLIAQEVETFCPGLVTTITRTKQGAVLTPETVVPAVYETRTVPAVLNGEGEVIEPETTEELLVTEEQVVPATYEEVDDSYKAIKNDVLIMKLLGAVAELSAEIDALKKISAT